MKTLLWYALLSLLITVPLAGSTAACLRDQAPAAAPGVDRGVALAFAGGVGALAVLDATLADQMARMPTATPAQLTKLQAQVDRLKRARNVLALVRTYIAGDAAPSAGPALLRDVLVLLDQVVDELRADGVTVPADAEAGLAALSTFFAAKK